MKIARIFVALAACAFAIQAYAGLDGKQIKVTAGEGGAHHAVVSIATDEDAEGTIVLEADGEKTHGTLHDGELVFIVDGLAEGESRTYAVSVSDDKAKPGVRLDPSGIQRAVDIKVGGEPFTSVHYNTDRPVFLEDDYKKPFLWPLFSAEGTPVTRAWPMGEEELSKDHPHHKSMWGAYGDINGADFWGEGGGSGRQIVNRIEYGSGDAMGWVRMEIILHANGGQDEEGLDKRGEPILKELREYRFYNTPEDGRYIDQTTTFVAEYGDAKFGDTKEGGIMAFRVRDIMTEREGGTITMTDGRTKERKVWGKPSPWCDYSGELGDAGVHGVAIFDHPGNMRHPSRWHVRGYGLMGANCFGLSYFTEREDEKLNGDFTLEKGEEITFKYRAYIHAGDANESNVATHYVNYATPPKAEWVN